MAFELGVAPRRFQGWEPTRFIEYVYDGDRLVGAIETQEPEFDDEQRALLIAYSRVKADVGRHGEFISEATSSEADPNNRSGTYRYKAGQPVVNWAERAHAVAVKAMSEKYPDAEMSGMIFPIEKVDR